MKEKDLRKQYQGLKEQYRTFEAVHDMLKGLRKDMENQNPYKVMDAAIERVFKEMQTVSEDMDFYLDRMCECEKED